MTAFDGSFYSEDIWEPLVEAIKMADGTTITPTISATLTKPDGTTESIASGAWKKEGSVAYAEIEVTNTGTNPVKYHLAIKATGTGKGSAPETITVYPL